MIQFCSEVYSRTGVLTLLKVKAKGIKQQNKVAVGKVLESRKFGVLIWE